MARSGAQDVELESRGRECEASVLECVPLSAGWSLAVDSPKCPRRRGGPCLSSPAARRNCALSCVSPACYDKVYGGDALEEGELDTLRGRSYRTCVRTDMRNLQLRAERAKREGASA